MRRRASILLIAQYYLMGIIIIVPSIKFIGLKFRAAFHRHIRVASQPRRVIRVETKKALDARMLRLLWLPDTFNLVFFLNEIQFNQWASCARNTLLLRIIGRIRVNQFNSWDASCRLVILQGSSKSTPVTINAHTHYIILGLIQHEYL